MRTTTLSRFFPARPITAGTALSLMLGLAPTSALAASAAANLNVSATVVNNCLISTGALAFGSYDPVVANAAVALDGAGTVTVACTKGTTATIGLNQGANASGGTRRMTDGSGNYLEYHLYQDSGHNTVWGNSGGDLQSPVAAPSKANRNFAVYGQVTGNQDIPAGAYSDIVVATVNF